MKITIDVDRLLKEGEITRDEYTRLRGFAQTATRKLAFKILVTFGILATAGGMLALFPSGITALLLGLILCAAGAWSLSEIGDEWRLMGITLLLVGSISAVGGLFSVFPTLYEVLSNIASAMARSFAAYTFLYLLLITILLLAASIVTKNGLLAAMSVLSLASAIGADNGYWHASYVLVIAQPALTVVLFSALAAAAYWASLRVPVEYEGIAIIFSRTSIFLVNLGFWVGSLWGDPLRRSEAWYIRPSEALIPDWIFVIAWAAALLAVSIWAARRDRRWVVTVAAVFGAIHFYTQFFERMGASPGSFVVAGLGAIAIAFLILRYNRKQGSQSHGLAM